MAKKNDPLRRYLQVQTRYDRELNKILERAARDLREQTKRLGTRTGIGAEIRTSQLAMVNDAIKRRQHALWVNQVRPTIVAGRVDAAKAAQAASEAMERTIFSALPDSRAATVTRALKASSEAGIELDFRRVPRELSTRIYNNRDLANKQVEATIRSGIIRGLSAKELADDVYRHVSPTAPGGQAAAAKRLARTEINNAFHEQQKAEADKPWVNSAKWNLSGSHPKPDECNVYATRDAHGLGGGKYPANKVPGKPHPNCLCYMTYDTVEEEEFLDTFFSGGYDGFLDKLG
jgi:hypothetical protein